jgi:hypothetical protein
MIKTANHHSKVETPHTNLAAAIVERAMLDYKDAYVCNDIVAIKTLRRFFRSDWFCFLSDLDGEVIMAQIERMVRK